MQSSISGLFQLVMVWLIPEVTQLYTTGSILFFYIPYSIIFGLAISFGIFLNIFLIFRPPPTQKPPGA